MESKDYVVPLQLTKVFSLLCLLVEEGDRERERELYRERLHDGSWQLAGGTSQVAVVRH